jgi:hypothetical protein
MISDTSPYCNLTDTGTIFNNKKVYSCEYCGIKIGLDNPDTKMFCFKKIQDFSMSIKKYANPSAVVNPIDIGEKEFLQDIVLNKVIQDHSEEQKIKTNENNPLNLCSEEQIESRLKVCRSCEFYKDNSCMLCGCQIVREANHMNKLAHKDQKCPADKWGPIVDE